MRFYGTLGILDWVAYAAGNGSIPRYYSWTLSQFPGIALGYNLAQAKPLGWVLGTHSATRQMFVSKSIPGLWSTSNANSDG